MNQSYKIQPCLLEAQTKQYQQQREMDILNFYCINFVYNNFINYQFCNYSQNSSQISMNNSSHNESGNKIHLNQNTSSHNKPALKLLKNQQDFQQIKNLSKTGGLFNFMSQAQARHFQKPYGKKCFSNHKSAVSNDSPEHFKLTHTIIVGKGISNNFDQKNKKGQMQMQNKKQRSESTNFYGNKNYFSISDQNSNQNCLGKGFLPEYTNTLKINQMPFHVKNYKCSKFLDENLNKLPGQNYPIMGFERNQQGRKINNNERKNNIMQKMKAREQLISSISRNRNQNRQTYSEWKIKTERISRGSSKSKNSQASNHSDHNSKLFILKSKVRKQRNQMADELNKQTGNLLQPKDHQGSLHKYQTCSHQYLEDKGFRSTASSMRPHTSNPNQVPENRTMAQLGNLEKYRHNKTKTISFDKNVTLQNGEEMLSKLDLWSAYVNPSNQNFRRNIIQRQSHLRRLKQK